MSTSEGIPSEAVDSKEAEDGIRTAHTGPLELDDTKGASLGNLSRSKTAVSVTMRQWKKIFTTVTTLIASAFLFGGISMIGPFYPIVAEQHHVPTYIVGFVIGTAAVCVAVMSPLCGYLLPYLGVKFTQLAGLLWGGGALILFGYYSIVYHCKNKFVPMMPTSTLFIVFSFLLRIVEGVGTAMCSTVSYTLLTQFYPDKKGTVVGLLQFALAAGYATGPAVAGGLQEVGGFPLPFFVVGGCIVILMLLLMILVPRIECVSKEVLPWRLVLKLFSNVIFVLVVITPALLNVSGCGILAYFGKFLYMQFNLSVGIIGITYFTIPVAYGLANIFFGLLTDRLKIHRSLTTAGLVVTFIACVFVGPAEFITTPTLWVSILAWILLGAGWGLGSVPIYPDMNEIASNLRMSAEEEASIISTLSGILVGAISAGECLGPIIGGALAYKVGFQSMAAILGLVPLVNALVLIVATVIQRVCKSRTCCKTKAHSDHDYHTSSCEDTSLHA